MSVYRAEAQGRREGPSVQLGKVKDQMDRVSGYARLKAAGRFAATRQPKKKPKNTHKIYAEHVKARGASSLKIHYFPFFRQFSCPAYLHSWLTQRS